MTRTRFEVVPPAPAPLAPHSGAAGSRGTIMIGLLIVAVLGLGAWLADQQFKRFLTSLDEDALGQATRTLEHVLGRQRDQLVSEVSVLSDDNRIRATVLAPKFDEATVQDTLEDLRKSSGATLLAVLDGSGRVQAVTGTGGLREVSLGASPAVKRAFDQPTSDVWTLPDQVQVIGLAPIRSGEQTPALLVKGLPLGQSQLSTVEKALGVGGAVFIGDRMAASSSQNPVLEEAFRMASRLAEGTQQITAGGKAYLARIGRTSEAATAARVVWLIPQHHHLGRAKPILLLIWYPVPLGAIMLLLLFMKSRRINGGNL
jgi:hypothetical protein